MVKSCCEKVGLKKGTWTVEEDQTLVSHIQKFGHGNWRTLPKQAGLLRCGKSCRFRWLNYLHPDIKLGDFSKEEEETVISLHKLLGNRWSAIAKKLRGRTDNEIKNYWHTHLKKRNKDNQAMTEAKQPSNEKSECTETKQPSSEISESDAKNQKGFQPILGYDVMSPQSFSSILSSNNGSSVIIIEESTEMGGNFSSQALLGEFLNPQWDFPSSFDDPGLQFPLSPLSFGEYDYLDSWFI